MPALILKERGIIHMKKSFALFLSLFLVFTLASAQAESYLLKLGTSLSDSDPITEGLMEFERIVEEQTQGDLQVEIYPSSQLGADEDLIEQCTMGMGIGLITDSGRLGTYVTEYGILGGPYLMDDYAEALEILDTPEYDQMCEKLTASGLRVLSGNWYAGARHLFMKQAVTKPADLSGLRVRSSGSAIVNASVKALGADPTVCPWSEAYNALQSKVVDGVEVNYAAAVGSSIYEVTSYICKTGHFQHILTLVVSDPWFNTLPAEYQTILMDAAQAAGEVASTGTIEKDADYEQQMVDAGMTIVEVDLDAFKDATSSVYEELGLAQLRDAIYAEIGK